MNLADPAVIAAIVGAFIAGGLGVLGPVFVWHRQQRREQRIAAARWLDDVAKAISDMASEFREYRIPYEASHRFDGLFPNYQPYLISFLGEDRVWDDMGKLRQLSERVQDMDTVMDTVWLEIGEEYPSLEDWLADMDRLAGDLRARAANLRAGP